MTTQEWTQDHLYCQGHYVGPTVYARGTVHVHRTGEIGAEKTAAAEYTVIDWRESTGRWLQTYDSQRTRTPRADAIAYVDGLTSEQ